jgi:hypothetical protein
MQAVSLIHERQVHSASKVTWERQKAEPTAQALSVDYSNLTVAATFPVHDIL